MAAARRLARTAVAAVVALLLALPAEAGRLLEGISLHSPVLGRDVPFTVYVPDGYPRGGPYASLWMLHGLEGDEYGWPLAGEIAPALDAAIARGDLPPVVVLMPGLGDGWYVDRPDGRPGTAVETAILRDLVPAAGALFGLIDRPGARGVGGLSMGGYGAVRLALRHPRVFGTALGFSATAFLDPGPEVYWDPLLDDRFGDLFGDPFDPDLYARYSLFRLVRPIADPPTIFLAHGDDDLPELMDGNRALARGLGYAGVPVVLRVADGTHDWPTWRSMLPEAFRVLGDAMRRRGYDSANSGRSLAPSQTPGRAAAIQAQPWRLPEATPPTNAPMLHPYPSRAP
jgi:enterochelin esterase-like enzyme